MTRSTPDYSAFDRPEILEVLFHPRKDFYLADRTGQTLDVLFDMPDGVSIGSTFHPAGPNDPVILFFHGNGEIVADYDDMGPLFTRMGIGFFPFDYRGYGRSTGKPTVSTMMTDCHVLFDQSTAFLKKNGFTGKIIVMGRSLGSASALELASSMGHRIDALIVESGFAFMMPLLELLGLSRLIPGLEEHNGPRNSEKIKAFTGPTLVIHAEYDHIIPFSDGAVLYENAAAEDKTLLEIKEADHNNLFIVGFDEYMNAVKDLAAKLR